MAAIQINPADIRIVSAAEHAARRAVLYQPSPEKRLERDILAAQRIQIQTEAKARAKCLLQEAADRKRAALDAAFAAAEQRRQERMAAFAAERAALATGRRRTPRPVVIVDEVALRHDVSVEALLGSGRQRDVTRARQELMYRLYTECKRLSTPAVGRLIGRDHTTVLHGIHTHAKRNGLPVPNRKRA